ncbi:unnamed protein product [Vitrella brassicaformis CCMP3155]|uniref:EF-hand domain-containing protein n=3 Tax=Vitrella brassicaformis TaxID=1169539 RepID=A0A0G4G949_VITBC|nr:unnamed protein product [Vitrella brassicaformis CCMP3155]|eukprot:CEM25353.1 unnamed protein product [Vitrella brassicaformis CCMP3155]
MQDKRCLPLRGWPCPPFSRDAFLNSHTDKGKKSALSLPTYATHTTATGGHECCPYDGDSPGSSSSVERADEYIPSDNEGEATGTGKGKDEGRRGSKDSCSDGKQRKRSLSFNSSKLRTGHTSLFENAFQARLDRRRQDKSGWAKMRKALSCLWCCGKVEVRMDEFDLQAITRDNVLTGEFAASQDNFKRLKRVRWIQSPRAQNLFTWLIVFNAVFIGLEIELNQNADNWQTASIFLSIELLFVVLFTIEQILHLQAEGLKYFRDFFNTMDFILVVLSIVENAVATLVAVEKTRASLADASTPNLDYFESLLGNHGKNSKSKLDTLLALRTLRLVRLLRMLRILRSYKELWLLVQGLGKSLRSLFWISVFLLMTQYICATFTTRLFGQIHSSDELMDEWWGSILRSAFTLFQLMTMEGWNEIARHTMDFAPASAIFFVAYILFTNVTLLNLVTGVIVEAVNDTSRHNEEESEVELQERRLLEGKRILREAFHAADHDNNHWLSKEELLEALSTRQFLDDLKRAQISWLDALDLVRIMHANNIEELRVEDFVEGVNRVKGPALSKHLLMLQFDQQRLLGHLSEALLSVQKHLNIPHASMSDSQRSQRDDEETNDGDEASDNGKQGGDGGGGGGGGGEASDGREERINKAVEAAVQSGITAAYEGAGGTEGGGGGGLLFRRARSSVDVTDSSLLSRRLQNLPALPPSSTTLVDSSPEDMRPRTPDLHPSQATNGRPPVPPHRRRGPPGTTTTSNSLQPPSPTFSRGSRGSPSRRGAVDPEASPQHSAATSTGPPRPRQQIQRQSSTIRELYAAPFRGGYLGGDIPMSSFSERERANSLNPSVHLWNRERERERATAADVRSNISSSPQMVFRRGLGGAFMAASREPSEADRSTHTHATHATHATAPARQSS